jgi:Cys-tRNA(Pro)/Cys-tRNA(Cys) deacylase
MTRGSSSGGTPALETLRRAGIDVVVHEYGPSVATPAERPGYGQAAAAALGIDPARIFKTLVATADDRLVAAVVPVATELDLKLLASAAGARKAVMADAAAAERATGYVRGGISPIGMRRRLPIYVDRSATTFATIFVSAGRRGLQVELSPGDLVRVAAATVAEIARRGG